MQMISDAAYEDLYKTAMDGISYKVAMQCIRKIMRDNSIDDSRKLELISNTIHNHERTMSKEAK